MVSQDAGEGPISLSVADFNKDGDLDLAIANSKENTISILLGSGNGGFDIHYKLSNEKYAAPNDIAIGDINNDGYLDVAVVNSNTSSVGIFLGRGKGKFSSQMTYSTGINSLPLGLALADVNNDRYLDLVVSENETSAVLVCLGDGKGKFQLVGAFSTGMNSHPSSIVIKDLNRDNYLDLIVTNSLANNVGIFLGDGTGIFTAQTTFSTGLYPRGLVVNDFNQDQIFDIATANSLGNSVSVLLGKGNGKFTTGKTFSTGNGSSPYSIECGDFDRDGKLDLAVVNSRTNNIGLLIGFGNGIFRQDKIYSTGKNSSPNDIAIGDFNGDNRLDIVSANYNDDNIGIFQNTCS